MTPLLALGLLFALVAAFAIAYAWFGPKESISEVLRAGDPTGFVPLVSPGEFALAQSEVDARTYLDRVFDEERQQSDDDDTLRSLGYNV